MDFQGVVKMEKRNYIDKIIAMEDILDENKFVIPQFQRELVWSKSKKYDFIRNLLDGDPFGITLIRQRDDGKYILIDGLQRITTIKDFYKNPFDYLKPLDIDMVKVEDLMREDRISKDLQVDEKYIQEKHEEWRKVIFDSIKNSEDVFDVIEAINEKYNLKSNKNINKIINEIYETLNNHINLDNLQIMAINYTGPEENIPNVFYQLNTGGVKLSKYETYSALWFKNKFKVEDPVLIEIVANKYAQLEDDSDLEVDFSKENLQDEGISIFEYCYALGIIMRSENKGFNILFGENTKTTDPIGFEILSLLLTNKVNDAQKMYELLKNVSPAFLVKLKNTIEKSLVDITKALKPLLLGKNNSHLYSENMYLIYHIIVSYIKEYYDIDPKKNRICEISSVLRKDNFAKYVQLHYFYDCITDFWKENRQVTDLQKAVMDTKNRQKYWHNIPPEDWENALNKFMNSQESVGKKVTQQNKLFIDFLTTLRLRDNSQYEKFFENKGSTIEEYPLDIEHIVPKKVISNHIKDLPKSKQQLIPVSAVGNLCYLTEKDNRSKKHHTLYEFVEDRPAFASDPEFIECIMYPSQDELKFINYDDERFLEEYDNFINQRQDKLQKEFLRLIKDY